LLRTKNQIGKRERDREAIEERLGELESELQALISRDDYGRAEGLRVEISDL